MPLMHYKIIEILEKNIDSTTDSHYGNLSILIKNDHIEAEAQVYSELVANKLAILLGIPVAVGVPAKFSKTNNPTNFVSLIAFEEGKEIYDFTKLDHRDLELPQNLREVVIKDMDHLQEILKLIRIYPKEIAYLTVFDYWIGNQDRMLNFKAEINTNERGLIFAIDHGSTLLACSSTINKSLEKLEDSKFPKFHPFQKLLSPFFVEEMIERIKSIPDWSLELATIFDENIGNATIADQYTLFDMLKKRRSFLQDQLSLIL